MRSVKMLCYIGLASCSPPIVAGDDEGSGTPSDAVPGKSDDPADDPGATASGARLYTADGTKFEVDQLGAALQHVLGAGSIDNLILYVHGRSCGGGGEPAKSLSGAMPALEADYAARALMFSWPGSSAGCPLGFPETQARASGPAFAQLLHRLATERASHPERFAGVALTLITHSMGNLVLQAAAEGDPSPLPTGLFDTVVLNSSATALANHRVWLAKVTWSPAVYVTENDDDRVLAAATAGRGTRLGKRLASEPLAENAIYVDFTASNVNHAYYLHSGQDGRHMRTFYDTVLNGRAFDFATAAGIAKVEHRSGTTIYAFDGS